MTTEKISALANALLNNPKKPENLRLLLITEKGFIRAYYDRISVVSTGEEYGIIRTLKYNRGDILDIFSKLEFFINEFIQLNMLGSRSEKALMLDHILEHVDFFSRIKLLNKWNIIDKKMMSLFMETKQVRNGLAHKWHINEVKYKDKKFKKNFQTFKNDIEEIWKELIEIYKSEQDKIDVNSILKEIELINK
jgi:hypothetical protein